MSRSRIRPYVGPFIALLVILALGVGTVYAAIPNPTNKRFYACFAKKTGDVRLIDYPKVSTCQKGERLVSWNAKGRAGPQGPQGPQGVQGPAGTSGSSDWADIANKPAGFADNVDNEGVTSVKLTRVTGTAKIVEGGDWGWAGATCPAGSKVTGGGFLVDAFDPYFVLQVSTSASDSTSWTVSGRNDGTDPLTLYPVVHCLSVQPAGAFTTAKKGLQPASVKKAMKNRR